MQVATMQGCITGTGMRSDGSPPLIVNMSVKLEAYTLLITDIPGDKEMEVKFQVAGNHQTFCVTDANHAAEEIFYNKVIRVIRHMYHIVQSIDDESDNLVENVRSGFRSHLSKRSNRPASAKTTPS
jgi:hypothetical protein